ncbi:MAG: methionine--tRNA ligase [Clostridiales bacterium]|nr:methionine--tRNA ligase [Clostridiales bacterium]
MSIFIGGAWPYANGSLHLGHIAALMPGDILARYFRLVGEDVLYVSGSDCHGTPISIRAGQEKVSPETITDRYHNEFLECFNKLGFSYDLYTRTDQEFHKKVVQEIFLKLFKDGYIYNNSNKQVYCEECQQFLPDRYVEGICPHCGNVARGDQCEYCSELLDPIDLKSKKCKICGSIPTVKTTEHLFFALSKFQSLLKEYIDESSGWRENALELAKRYLKEGLRDRAVTRDLPWGVEVPIDGFEGKKIYVWIEAVIGYLSASKQWASENNCDWEKFWKGDVVSYYVHGKDNIPFHTLILPALLSGIGDLHLPDKIISSEYLTLEGRKISTSNNWAVWVPYIVKNYNPDSIRYFLTINGPEKRDGDFSWREFISRHNGELLGAFGNFVNRTLAFIQKSFNGRLPIYEVESDIQEQISRLYNVVGDKISEGQFKNALEEIFEFVRYSNKYFDEKQPWVQLRENRGECEKTLYTCVQIIANLSNLLTPFIPFSCDKIRGFLNIPAATWKYIELDTTVPIGQIEVLFERIDKCKIQEEVSKIGNIE